METLELSRGDSAWVEETVSDFFVLKASAGSCVRSVK